VSTNDREGKRREEGIGGREGKGKETGQGNCGSGVKLEKGGDRKGQAGEGREPADFR